MKHYTYVLTIFASMLAFASCKAPGGNSPGSEYMPDMGHSVAFEANHYQYYYNHVWGGEDEYYQYAKPKLPVKGTVPRVSTNYNASSDAIAISSVVGSTTYDYGDTEEERVRATNELLDNAYPITDAGLKRGENLYNIFCATCHGEKGDGAGYLVRDDGGKYPAQPANFLLEEHLEASNGRYYHAIMHGKNLMGHYKDKINTEERWQVIHWIRALQAKELKKEYNQYVNTLNSVDRPAGDEVVVMVKEDSKGGMHSDGHNDTSHSNNGGDHGEHDSGDHNEGH